VPQFRSDGGTTPRTRTEQIRDAFDPKEVQRRNPSSVAIDALYLFTTAFLATVFVRTVWSAVIVALPLFTMIYFAWRSTAAFFAAQVLAVALAVAATYTGVLPL
jgi:hypothetical protein